MGGSGPPSYQLGQYYLPPGMMGGSGKLGDASWQNPDIAPFINALMGHQVSMAGLTSQDYRAGLGLQGTLGAAQAAADAQRHGYDLSRLTAQDAHTLAQVASQAQYGSGGLAQQQMDIAQRGATLQEDRLQQETQQAALQREFQNQQQAADLASRQQIASMPHDFLREMMKSPLMQNVFGGGQQGYSTAPSSMQSYGGGGSGGGPGYAEQEFMRRELPAQGRRAADEAEFIQGAVEQATGPGGAGMGGGPAGAHASRLANLQRLQVGAQERAAERQRLMDMQLAQRGQSLGLVGSIFG